MSTLEHIERCRPPWRTVRLTECGHKIDEFASVLTREEAVAKFKRLGPERAAFSTCMTCTTAIRYNWKERWEDNPSAVVARDSQNSRTDLLAGELTALAILWERHQAEYAQIVADIKETVDLSSRRAAKVGQKRTQ